MRSASPAAAERHGDAIAAERLQMFCGQSVLIPFGVAVLCGYIVYMLWAHHRHDYLIAWAVATWGALALRAALAGRLAKRALDRDQVSHWTRFMIGICFVNGLLGGAAGFLFFEGSPLAAQALLTMLLCCWSAGAMATSGAIPLAFYAFLLPFLAPITSSWLATDIHGSNYTALLIVFFAAYEVIFVRDNARVLVNAVVASNRSKALALELDQKRLEAETARARAEEANQSKSRFLAAASHDLRQPMYALSLYATLLRKAAKEDETRKISDHIEFSVQALDGLFVGLLDISRFDAGIVKPNWQTCTVEPVFEGIERQFGAIAESKGLRLEVRACPAQIRTDPGLLGRIVGNLVSNAVRYTKRGGIELRAAAAGSSLAIEVADTGIGIAPEEIERIFEEFYQVGNPERDRAEGHGLGLAIVRRLVNLLQCELKVESQPGRGSTFRVLIPLSSEPIPAGGAVPPQPQEREIDLTGLVVLVIDDEREVRAALEDLFSSWGCACVAAAGHDDAVAAVEERAAEVDLIIADYRLAKGENGIDTVRRLRERLGNLPALLVTGDTAPDRLLEAQASGYSVLHKPVTAQDLRRKVVEVYAAR
ncbi:MAG: hybrid sensor histidine kinase/response regulator [Burkholderiales bacterium]|nr:hybrid sensor histidine kinase/response regulator [Burkholderiales bacterium]